MGQKKRTKQKAKERRYWKGRTPYDNALDVFERRFLEAMFRECGGNKMEAARRLGFAYATLKYRLTRLSKAEAQDLAPGKGTPDMVARVRDGLLTEDESSLDSELHRVIASRLNAMIRDVEQEARKQIAAGVYRIVSGD